MLGILVVAVAGLVAWKYRDSLVDYAKGNTAPAREKLDELLLTTRQKSEAFLDQTKDQISSGLEGARERLKAGTSKADGKKPSE